MVSFLAPHLPRSRPPHRAVAAAILPALAAAALFGAGCSSDKSTTASINSSEPSTIDQIRAIMSGEPAPTASKPLTREEGMKLIQKIRANPAKLQALTPQEKLFLAKAAYHKDDDDF